MISLIQPASRWAIEPTHYLSLVKARGELLERFDTELQGQLKSDAFDFDRMSEYLSFYIPQRQKAELDHNGVGHIHILGALGFGLAPIDKLFGMTDYRDLMDEVDSLHSQGARGIFIQAHTPGGTVLGLPEAADQVDSLDIPWGVHSDALIASAGYYYSAGADFISTTRSADSGSIGTIIPWIDMQGVWEAYGIEWNPIISEGSDLKGMGGGPVLDDKHRAELQRVVNVAKDDFIGHIDSHRSGVSKSLKRGQSVEGSEALAGNLIDYIESVDSAYDRLLSLANK